jgi:hypothetical protein
VVRDPAVPRARVGAGDPQRRDRVAVQHPGRVDRLASREPEKPQRVPVPRLPGPGDDDDVRVIDVPGGQQRRVHG